MTNQLTCVCDDDCENEKKTYIRTLYVQGKTAICSHLVITISNNRLSGS